jgi:hypothetical protein
MLENKLQDIPYILLLRSDKVLKDLLDFNNESMPNSSLSNAIEDFYPNKFRKESLDRAYNKKCQATSLDYSFECLDDLYEEYFRQDGSRIYAKPEKLERYSSIINKIHPFNIVGYYLANKLAKGEIDLHTIEDLAGNISPLGFDVGDGKRYSDNHVHLFGVKESSISIWHIFNNKFTKDISSQQYTKNKKDEYIEDKDFLRIIDGDFTILKLRDIGLVALEAIYKYTLHQDIDIINDIQIRIQNIYKNSTVSMEKGFNYLEYMNRFRLLAYDTIEKKVFQLILKKHEENSFIDAWLFLNVFLHYIYMTTDKSEIKKFIKIFFHCSNLIRSHLVMGEHIGLGYFTKYFGISNGLKIENFENLLENNEYSILTDILKSGTTSLEAKLSPTYLSIGKYKENFQKKDLLGSINQKIINKDKY